METGTANHDPVALFLGEWASTDLERRRRAVQALIVHGPAAEAAVPALLNGLRDDDLAVRPLAALALTAIGERAVRPIVEALLEPNVDYRRALLLVLKRLGPTARAARPVLEAACRDEVLGPLAEEVRRRVCPTVWERFRRWLKSWRDWALLFAAVVFLAVALALGGILGSNLAPTADTIALKTALSVGFLGLGVGALGGSRWGVLGSVAGALVVSVGGGCFGYLAGDLFGHVVQPLLEVLSRS